MESEDILVIDSGEESVIVQSKWIWTIHFAENKSNLLVLLDTAIDSLINEELDYYISSDPVHEEYR